MYAHIMRLLVVGFVILVMFIMTVYLNRREDVWKKYKLTPVKSEELDDWMEAYRIYLETYESVEDVPNKVALRISLEDTRKSILDWYTSKGEELGLDPLAAENFGRDMIRQEKI
jgi:hypothetical protein